MARVAVDIDHLTGRVDVFGDGEPGIQLVAVLVEVSDFELGAVGYAAALWLELFEQEIEQGGFAGAVETNDADLVAAPNGGGEILDERCATPRVGDVVDGDDLAAGKLRVTEVELGLALEVAALGALVAD